MCKAINYCIALELWGTEKVHKHVGQEPSGVAFNALHLNPKGLPHNPLINSGAIMMASLIKPELNTADRFEHIKSVWRDLAGGKEIQFDMGVYLSEKATAYRNQALAYFMLENKAFPENVNLQETLELYFQCCSLMITSDAMGVLAGTMANGGMNPLTGK